MSSPPRAPARGGALLFLFLFQLARGGEDELAAHDDLDPDRARPVEARRVRGPVVGGEVMREIQVAEVVALDPNLLLPALPRPLGRDDEGGLVAVEVFVLVAHPDAHARRLRPLPVNLSA